MCAPCLPCCSGNGRASDEFATLMSQCAFDPNAVKPKADFDFSPHLTSTRKAKRAKKNAQEDQGEEGSPRLPKRLLLSAFSRQVGLRICVCGSRASGPENGRVWAREG